ncbi:MAG: hypothetical protein ABIC91_07635 [Nanoarchaeota archaeon]
MKNEQTTGLKLTDLAGEMKTVEILDQSLAEKDGKKIVVLKCKLENDKPIDIGFFGEDVATKVLETRGSKQNGKLLLEIPASKTLSNDKIVWFNSVY